MRACTVKTAAELLGCKEDRVLGMIRRGELKALQTSKPWLVVYKTLRPYLVPDHEGLKDAIARAIAQALSRDQAAGKP